EGREMGREADVSEERADSIVAAVEAHEVHLQKRKALVHPLFQALARDGRIGIEIRVGVDPDRVAKLAAEKLIDRHAVVLADNVPKRHLHRAHPAALPRMMPE